MTINLLYLSSKLLTALWAILKLEQFEVPSKVPSKNGYLLLTALWAILKLEQFEVPSKMPSKNGYLLFTHTRAANLCQRVWVACSAHTCVIYGCSIRH